MVLALNADDHGAIREGVAEIRAYLAAHPIPGLCRLRHRPGRDRRRPRPVANEAGETLLLATLGLVLVLLLLVYRAPLLALLPLIAVGAAYMVAIGIAYLLIKGGWIVVNTEGTFLLLVLVFGAGTDYSLLLVHRYREEIQRGRPADEALPLALRETIPAVGASGGTVIAAMLVLLVADLQSTHWLGPILAIGIAVMVCSAFTLLPALLAVLGERAFWPTAGAPRRPGPSAGSGSRAWSSGARGRSAAGHRRPRRPRARQLPPPRHDRLRPGRDQADQLERRHRGAERTLPARPRLAADRGRAARRSGAGDRGDEAPRLGAAGDPGPGGQRLRIGGGRCSSSPATRTRAKRRRRSKRSANACTRSRRAALLGGLPAENWDVEQTNGRDTRLIVPLVLLVVGLILAAVLRAIAAPLYLIATVVLSFAGTLGLSTFLFSQFGGEGITFDLTLLAFLFLVALGVDYNIFLMTRVREEARRHGTQAGTLRALIATGGVVTGAGLILAGTFATLTLLPLEELIQIGATVAIGVLLDTFIVRALLIPAITYRLGDRAWWPARRAAPAARPDAPAP